MSTHHEHETPNTDETPEVSPPATLTATIRKALAALVFGFAGALGTAMLDSNLASGELIAAGGVGLVSGAAVWRIPNAYTRETIRRAMVESVRKQQQRAQQPVRRRRA